MHTFFPEHKLILLQLKGHLSVEEIIDKVRKVTLDDEFDRSYKALLDNRQLVPNFSANSLKKIIEISSLAVGHTPMPVAVVTASFIRARIVDVVGAALLSGIRIKAFSEVDDAMDWLQLDDNAKERLYLHVNATCSL